MHRLQNPLLPDARVRCLLRGESRLLRERPGRQRLRFGTDGQSQHVDDAQFYSRLSGCPRGPPGRFHIPPNWDSRVGNGVCHTKPGATRGNRIAASEQLSVTIRDKTSRAALSHRTSGPWLGRDKVPDATADVRDPGELGNHPPHTRVARLAQGGALRGRHPGGGATGRSGDGGPAAGSAESRAGPGHVPRGVTSPPHGERPSQRAPRMRLSHSAP